MDINKILSEQQNLNLLNLFGIKDISSVKNNAETFEISINPDVAEVSDAINIQDEDAAFSFDNIDLAKFNKSATNINSMMNFMSNQVQNQENKEKQIEEEITKKQEEYQKLAEDIQEKQEEYESLVKQAESEQDQSIAEQATALGEEINSMVSNLESIKTSIDNLETNLKTQENLTSILKQTSQTMSKVQTQVSKEVVQAIGKAQIQVANEVAQTNVISQTQATNQVLDTPVDEKSYEEKLSAFKQEIYQGVSTPQFTVEEKLKEKGYNSGISFYMGYCRLTEGCRNAGHTKDNFGFTDNLQANYETMFNLSDKANFVMTSTYVFCGTLCALEGDAKTITGGSTKPYIIVCVDGVAQERIYLDAEDSAPENFKKLLESKIDQYDGINKTTTENKNFPTNTITNAGEIDKVSPTQETQPATSGRKRVETKTYEEYAKDLDTKFEELYAKYGGNSDEIEQYIKNNRFDLLDIDGDGRLTNIDKYVVNRYKADALQKKYSSRNTENETKENIRFNFAQIITKDITTQFMNNATYDLVDLENLLKVSGGEHSNLSKYGVNIKNLVNIGSSYSALDCGAISQCNNWEERFINVYNALGGSPHNIEKIKEKIQKCAEYIEKNPQNADFANIAVEYQMNQENHIKKLENGTYDNLAKSIINNAEKFYENLKDKSYKNTVKLWHQDALEQGYNYTFDEYCEYLAYDGYKGRTAEDLTKELIKEAENKLTNQVKERNIDINGDGISNTLDYITLSNNIDLNNDGLIDESEKKYLDNNKNKIKANQVGINKVMDESAHFSLLSIDEIIANIDADFLEEQNRSIEKTKEILQNLASAGVDFIGQASSTGMRAFLRELLEGYSDGSKKYSVNKDYFNKGHVETLSYLLDGAKDFYNLPTIYKHYIASANLSKTELEDILYKIKSASQKAQTELSEVVKAIEQRLAGIS